MSEEIKKILDNHEKRISELEKKLVGSIKKPKESVAERKTISGHLEYLKSEGFFDQPKKSQEIVEKLAQEGFHYAPQSLTWSLQKAVQKNVLGRVKKEKKWAYCKR